jgi:hypothetical protein
LLLPLFLRQLGDDDGREHDAAAGISRPVGIWCKISAPERTAKTLSRLMSRDARVGWVYFCPIICRV